jgi:hypothetical protein
MCKGYFLRILLLQTLSFLYAGFAPKFLYNLHCIYAKKEAASTLKFTNIVKIFYLYVLILTLCICNLLFLLYSRERFTLCPIYTNAWRSLLATFASPFANTRKQNRYYIQKTCFMKARPLLEAHKIIFQIVAFALVLFV